MTIYDGVFFPYNSIHKFSYEIVSHNSVGETTSSNIFIPTVLMVCLTKSVETNITIQIVV